MNLRIYILIRNYDAIGYISHSNNDISMRHRDNYGQMLFLLSSITFLDLNPIHVVYNDSSTL